MNKSELIRELGRTADLSRPEAKRIVDAFFDEMATALAKGGAG